MTARMNVALSVASTGWNFAAAQDLESAHLSYSIADDLTGGRIDPDLSLLRHISGGLNGGTIQAAEPTEDRVRSLWLSGGRPESDSAAGLSFIQVNPDDLVRNIGTFLKWFDPGFHRRNIPCDRPHVFVLSTGRCGTVSLFHLLKKDPALAPHHSYWFNVSLESHIEMMCRLVKGEFEGGEPLYHEWLSTRAAEWLGAIGGGRTMVALNHMDTIFAPVFAALHPKAKFVYFRRDPSAVFKSFYSKKQWQGQIQPALCSFESGFKWRGQDVDLPSKIAWYVHFTEVFAEAMGRLFPLYAIRSEDMFAGHVGGLLDFIGADIDPNGHFETKINEKAHKAAYSNGELVAPKKVFLNALERVREAGRL